MTHRDLFFLGCILLLGSRVSGAVDVQGVAPGSRYEWREVLRTRVGDRIISRSVAVRDGVVLHGVNRAVCTLGTQSLEFVHELPNAPRPSAIVAETRHDAAELRELVELHLGPGFEVVAETDPVYMTSPTDPRLHLIRRFLAWRDRPREDREIAIDATDGTVRWDRALLRGIDILGTVSGRVPLDPFPYFGPAGLVTEPLPHLTLSPVGLTPTASDASGSFVIPCPGGAVTVFARLEGPYFSVLNQAGPEVQFIGTLSPGAPQQILFNASPNDEVTAEVSAFHALGRAFAFINELSPGFAPSQVPVDAFVNQPGQCYAFYSPLFAAMYFTAPGAGCPNAAYSTVVAHEYFHHLAFGVGGTYSEPYEEAMADVFAAFTFATSVIGSSFFGLGADLRPLDGSAQFPHPSPDPTVEGLPLAQAFWDMRENLMADVGPVAGAELAAQLWLASFLVGDGEVGVGVLEQLLALDDDDGDPANGTPHGPSILAAFAAHGFLLPVASITDLVCEIGLGSVDLSWSVPAPGVYDAINLFRDGALIATLSGTASEYSDVLPGPGIHFYALSGEVAGTTTTPALCTINVPAFTTFIRGDANGDGAVNVIDAVRIVGVLFQGVPNTVCGDALDANDSGAIDLADVSFLLPHLFLMTPPPPPPYPGAGVDPTPDGISCP